MMEVSGKKLRNLCQPCEKRKSSTYTDRSCLHCEEEMCQSCFDTHVQFKVGREHRLVKSFEVPLKKEETHTFDNCTKHLNEAVKFFCPEHSQVGCADCIIISHKNCKIEYILECINEYKDSEESNRFKKDIEKYDSEAKSMLESIKRNKVHVTDVNNNFVRDVNLFRDEMISHITHLAETMLQFGNKTMREDKTNIENLEEEIKSLVDETTKMTDKLQSEADQPYKLFITTVSYKQNLFLVQEQLKRIKEMNMVRKYTFENDCYLEQLVKNCKQLGSIQGVNQLQTGNGEVSDGLPEFSFLRRLKYPTKSRLRDYNPNITELSDQIRPTKVAEKFSEVYDNQWTDAFDILEEQMEEKQAIDTLLNTLMTAHNTCQKLSSRNFFERVQKAMELPIESAEISNCQFVLSDQFIKEIKVFRKIRAPFVIRDVEKAVRPRLQLAKHQSKEVQEYVTACVEISWFCAVQDPPLDLVAKNTNVFDTNLFKDYTKRGKFVDFVVWPAMLCHNGGPLLAKGVAQGRCDRIVS